MRRSRLTLAKGRKRQGHGVRSGATDPSSSSVIGLGARGNRAPRRAAASIERVHFNLLHDSGRSPRERRPIAGAPPRGRPSGWNAIVRPPARPRPRRRAATGQPAAASTPSDHAGDHRRFPATQPLRRLRWRRPPADGSRQARGGRSSATVASPVSRLHHLRDGSIVEHPPIARQAAGSPARVRQDEHRRAKRRYTLQPGRAARPEPGTVAAARARSRAAREGFGVSVRSLAQCEVAVAK